MDIPLLWLEALFIFVLILINGFFAGSEIAVVSSRKSRVGQLAKEGRRGARIVSSWLSQPEDFLATVQIAVTLVGALASAVGGAAAIEYLKPRLHQFPLIARWAHPVSIALVVLPITYFSLVVGELVPKSLALLFRERLALKVAYPIHWISRVARPLVWILSASTRVALLLFGQKKMPKEMFASEEEIRFMLQEGGTHGIFDQTEQQMIPKVFDFANLQIKDVMVPRSQIFAIDVTLSREELINKVSDEGFTRVPVYQGSLDKVVGILHIKDLIYILSIGQAVILQDLIRPAVFVLETTYATDLLKLFQKQRLHMALIQNARHEVVGLVTLENLIERIVGDIQDEHDTTEETRSPA